MYPPVASFVELIYEHGNMNLKRYRRRNVTCCIINLLGIVMVSPHRLLIVKFRFEGEDAHFTVMFF